MVAAIAPAPPSGRSSRATQVTTAWPSPMRSTASATRAGSSGDERERVARVDLAEAAGPGAALPVDHEGRRPVGPALVDVRAARLLAHRDEPEIVDGAAEAAVSLSDVDGHPHPGRLPLPDVEARLGRHAGLAQPTKQWALLWRVRTSPRRHAPAPRPGAPRCLRPNTDDGTRHERVDDRVHRDVDPFDGQRGHRRGRRFRTARCARTCRGRWSRSGPHRGACGVVPLPPAGSAPRWRRSCGGSDRRRRAIRRGTRPRSSPPSGRGRPASRSPPAPGGARAPGPAAGSSGTVTIG